MVVASGGSLQGVYGPEAGSGETNPYGFAALAVLVGLFTEQAAQRLKEVAENVFAKARPGNGHAGPQP